MIEIVGLIAGIFTTGSQLPQAVKVYQSGRTGDLSFSFTFMLFVGTLFWSAYGLLIGDVPVILFNSVSAVLTGYLFFAKTKKDVLEAKHVI